MLPSVIAITGLLAQSFIGHSMSPTWPLPQEPRGGTHFSLRWLPPNPCAPLTVSGAATKVRAAPAQAKALIVFGFD
jgi:hypothetical protein